MKLRPDGTLARARALVGRHLRALRRPLDMLGNPRAPRPPFASRRNLLTGLVVGAMAFAAGPYAADAARFKVVRRGMSANYPGANASVTSPASGTSLINVWNLQKTGATGPRSAFSNGTWSGTLDAYLTGVGFVIGNDNGSLFLSAGSGTVTVSNYDFTSTPRIQVRGTGTVNFVDCKFNFSDAGGFTGPKDINGNPTGEELTLNFSYCLFNITVCFHDSGTVNYSRCRWSNQVQFIWGSTTASILIEDSYVTGGGCNPPADAHVELIQWNTAAPDTFIFRRNIVNFIDGQASLSPTSGNYGWTGIFTSPGGGILTLEDCIIIGITEVDDNVLNPDRIGCTVQYDNGSTITITNCVLQAAQGAPGGYSSNGNGGVTRPTVSGNRTWGNVALTALDFG